MMVFRLIEIHLHELKMRSAYIKWYLIWKTMCFQPIKVTKLVFELTSIPERETNWGWKMKTEFADLKWGFLKGPSLAFDR